MMPFDWLKLCIPKRSDLFMAITPLQIQKISQVSIRVHDLDVATPFYQETLGLTLLFRAPNMALFDCNGIRILLGTPESPKYDHPSSNFYFYVEDIHGAYETLVSQGVSIVSKPHKIAEFGGKEIWMAFFHDPDENVHALTSEIPLG
jgi:catechol 2,3-dioxygenase-like lactoylglutathione lyase family enzyme